MERGAIRVAEVFDILDSDIFMTECSHEGNICPSSEEFFAEGSIPFELGFECIDDNYQMFVEETPTREDLGSSLRSSIEAAVTQMPHEGNLELRGNLHATDTSVWLVLSHGKFEMPVTVLNFNQHDFPRWVKNQRPAFCQEDILIIKALRRRWQNLHHSETARQKRRKAANTAQTFLAADKSVKELLLQGVMALVAEHYGPFLDTHAMSTSHIDAFRASLSTFL